MNQNVSQLGQQLAAIWKQLGLNQRISVVLAAVVVLGGLFSLSFWSSRADYALLYGRLDDAEAAKVVAALNDLKIPYRTGPGSSSIQVPADKVYLARMQLAGKGIPRSDGVGFEIFDKANFGISDFVQRANYLRAIQGELARTISQLDEVEAARVMIVMPENRLLIDQNRRATASVFVKVRGRSPLPSQAVNSIRFLVANSVEGLQPNFVSVVDNAGNVLSENSADDSVAGLSNTQLAARKNVEQYLAKKAEGMLEQVLGPGQAVVRVATEINFDTLTRVEEKFDPEGQVLRSATTTDESTDSTTANASTGGVPGVSTNSNTETNKVAASPQNNSRVQKKQTTSQYEINRVSSNTVQAAGGLRRVSAAVFIAAKFDGKGAERKAAPRSDEELKKLKRIVQSALGISEGDPARNDEITLEEMPFNDQFGTELTQQFQQQERQQFWLELAKNAAYPLLALAVLFVFWRSLKRTSADIIPIGIPLGKLGGNGNGNGNGNGHGAPSRSPASDPDVLTVEAFNQLIRENPGNTSQAIRSWMARGKTPQS